MISGHSSISSLTNRKLIGIGDDGSNSVNWIIEQGIENIESIVINTTRFSLKRSCATVKLQIGEELTNSIEAVLKGADVVFIIAGMGSQKETSVAQTVAQIAKKLGVLTIGIATKPFIFEGRKRMENSRIGIAKLNDVVDMLIVLSNDRFVESNDDVPTVYKWFAHYLDRQVVG